jgi:hypothetical protein
MTSGALIWLIIFGISAAGFFLIAAVVGYKGFADLQVLLRHSGRLSPKCKVQGQKTEDHNETTTTTDY